ncbi:hypothetical protein FS842_004480 [Serendipita sp. 407]|nr:hypothetical protein FS842_004480 [Serendipita sp. 407]
MAALTILSPSIRDSAEMSSAGRISSSSYMSNSSGYTTNSNGCPSIQLLCSMPGPLPRASTPTPQRLLHVAASLSVHLSNADLAHVFLGRFSLFLRGANVTPKWVDVDVVKPIIGGTQRVKDVLALHDDLAIHGEVHEDASVDRLLVSHRCGIYLRLSVGAIPSPKKKTELISAHLDIQQGKHQANTTVVVLPCLTPARQFLETVLIASSADSKVEDVQDLIWMKDNLRVDMINDPTTMKKTWEDGKLQKVVDTWPEVSSTFVELGLMADTTPFSSFSEY